MTGVQTCALPISTVFKRRRYIPEISSKDPRFKSFAERTAINMPLQGTASDVIKIAMNHLDAALKKKNLRSRMLLQVHDELLLEAPKKELEAVTALVRDKMQNAVSFLVPMDVSVKAGPNWLDMHEV